MEKSCNPSGNRLYEFSYLLDLTKVSVSFFI